MQTQHDRNREDKDRDVGWEVQNPGGKVGCCNVGTGAVDGLILIVGQWVTKKQFFEKDG